VAIARQPFAEAADVLRGMSGVKRALSFADPVRESPIESLSYGHMVEAGLPLPTCQYEVRTAYGVYFPDFFWEGEGVIGEADGRVKYVDSGAVMREREREQVLRDLGFRIVRWSGKEIHLSPSVVMDRIERALG
jgi:very-short-patch-repair endonuclease